VSVEKVSESKLSENASKSSMLSEPQVITPCGMSLKDNLLTDQAAAGVKAARAQHRLQWGTREKLIRDV